MSKTSQRKLASFDLGYSDAKKGLPVRWKRHWFMAEYKEGRRVARAELARTARVARGEPEYLSTEDIWPEPT